MAPVPAQLDRSRQRRARSRYQGGSGRVRRTAVGGWRTADSTVARSIGVPPPTLPTGRTSSVWRWWQLEHGRDRSYHRGRCAGKPGRRQLPSCRSRRSWPRVTGARGPSGAALVGLRDPPGQASRWVASKDRYGVGARGHHRPAGCRAHRVGRASRAVGARTAARRGAVLLPVGARGRSVSRDTAVPTVRPAGTASHGAAARTRVPAAGGASLGSSSGDERVARRRAGGRRSRPVDTDEQPPPRLLPVGARRGDQRPRCAMPSSRPAGSLAPHDRWRDPVARAGAPRAGRRLPRGVRDDRPRRTRGGMPMLRIRSWRLVVDRSRGPGVTAGSAQGVTA